VWWVTPVNLGQRQEDYKFKASLNYIVKPCLKQTNPNKMVSCICFHISEPHSSPLLLFRWGSSMLEGILLIGQEEASALLTLSPESHLASFKAQLNVTLSKKFDHPSSLPLSQ
jgi:hypothetical protein